MDVEPRKFPVSQSAAGRRTNRLSMKPRAFPLLPVAFAALSSAAVLSAASAQEETTTTTTTTTLPGQPTPAQTQTTTTTVEPAPAAPAPPAVERVANQHVVEIELAVKRGSVQAYFGRAPRGEKLSVGSAELSFKLPSTATVTKLASRDDDSPGSHKVTADHPWHVSVPFEGPGRYVFNISDWDDDPVVTVALVKVDGVVLFSGHGSEDDLNGWVQHTYGENVRKTGSREIAFVLAAE